MSEIPLMVQVAGRSVLIVGGGSVALRRARAFYEAGAAVTVVAPTVDPAIETLGCEVERRAYRSDDAAGRWIVVAATDDPTLNARITTEARAAGALVNRADDPPGGDVVVPAHRRVGPITVAVSTAGISAAAGATIRDQLIDAMDDHWPGLLETVAPFRRRIQRITIDPASRQALLRQLADAQAMTLFKQNGADAVRQRCERLIDEATGS